MNREHAGTDQKMIRIPYLLISEPSQFAVQYCYFQQDSIMNKTTVINSPAAKTDITPDRTVINSGNARNSSDAAKTVSSVAPAGITAVRSPDRGVTAVNAVSSVGFDMTGETVLEKYEIREKLDVTSGEADLYLCTDKSTGTEYILKLYRRKDAIKDEMLDELTRIRSKYIGSLVDYGRFNDYTFAVITYFRNGSLRGRKFSIDELKTLVIPSVNAGLRVLHEAGIIHKDIKPSNLMLSDDGKYVSIIDFGISSIVDDQTMLITRTGMSPVYSAPETFNNVFLAESDYYSLGITLYELYTGHTPYEKLDIDDMAAFASVQNIPFPDDFDQNLKLLIQGLTYKDLSNRKDPDNINRRWTEAEVQKWIDGDPFPAPGTAAEIRTFANTLSFAGRMLKTADEIADAFGKNWDLGKKFVGRGDLAAYFRRECAEEYANFANDCEAAGVSDFDYFKLLYNLSDDKSIFYWNDTAYDDIKLLALDILSAEQKGSTVFANDDFLWSLHYFYSRDAVISDTLDKIFEKKKNGHVAFHLCMLDVAYLLGAVFLVDNQVFSSPEEVQNHFSNLKKKSDNDFFLAVIRCYYVLNEYSIIVKDGEPVFRKLMDTNVLDLILDYTAVTADLKSLKILQKFGIIVVDADVKKFQDLFRYVSPDYRIRILYFKVSPSEKFFVSDEDPQGPEEINVDLIVLGPAATSVANMFAGCSRLRKVPNFNTSGVDDMFGMFKGCSSLTRIPKYKTERVTNMNQMFDGCSSLTEIPLFDTGNVTNTGMMFNNCSSLRRLPSLNLSSVTNMVLMFSRCSKLTAVPEMNTGSVRDMSFMFSGCRALIHVPQFDMSQVVSTRGMFMNCSSLKNFPVDDLPHVRNMSAMFKNCSSLSLLPKLNTPHAEDMSELFFGCCSLEDGPEMETSSVINMSGLFNGCSSLRKIPRYRTDRVRDMQCMFADCVRLAEIPSMHTEKVNEMGSIFRNCSSLIHAPDMNTSSVSDMNRMFFGCSSLKKIPAYDTARVLNMDYMFAGCKSLKRIPRMNTKNVLDSNGMYEDSSIPDNIFRYESTFYIMLGSVAFLLIAASVAILIASL